MSTTAVNNELQLALATLMTQVPARYREGLRGSIEVLAKGLNLPIESLEYLYGERPLRALTGFQGRRPVDFSSERTLIEVCMDHRILPGGPYLTTIGELAKLTRKSEGTLKQYRYARSRRDDEFRTTGKPLGGLSDGSGAMVLWFPTHEAILAGYEKELGHPIPLFSDWWPTAAENPLARFTRSRQKR